MLALSTSSGTSLTSGHTTFIYRDNVYAMYLASNPIQHHQAKHLEIDLHFLCEQVDLGDVRLVHIIKFMY